MPCTRPLRSSRAVQQCRRDAEQQPRQQVAREEPEGGRRTAGVWLMVPVDTDIEQYSGRRTGDHHRHHHDPPHAQHHQRVGPRPAVSVALVAGRREFPGGHRQRTHAGACAVQHVPPAEQAQYDQSGGCHPTVAAQQRFQLCVAGGVDGVRPPRARLPGCSGAGGRTARSDLQRTFAPARWSGRWSCRSRQWCIRSRSAG